MVVVDGPSFDICLYVIVSVVIDKFRRVMHTWYMYVEVRL